MLISILSWIEDQKKLKILNYNKSSEPGGLWTRCDNCGTILYIKHLKENQCVCFACGYHLQMSSRERIKNLIDIGTWRPLDETLSPCDPLDFCDQKTYSERLKDAQDRTNLQDAILTGTGLIDGIPVALGVMDFSFMGGSMGMAVGTAFCQGAERALARKCAYIVVTAAGGARMQEGILSLMQLAKTSAALAKLSAAKVPYFSILTNPTMAGVMASYASLGDVIIAEPEALIGFAGPRVIRDTTQSDLPKGFQTSEFLKEHGLIDAIVPRKDMRDRLAYYLDFVG